MGNNSNHNHHNSNNNVIIEAASKNTKVSSHLSVPHTTSSIIAAADNDNNVKDAVASAGGGDHDDRFNYALLLALYTLQGIPMGLSASIPFLIQQKVQMLASSVHHHASAAAGSSAAASAAAAAASATPNNSLAELTKMAYNAQAIFALCSWPFSLKLLWAPIVDACFSKKFGRRKSWLVPIQLLAGILMVSGSGYVESELGLENVVTVTSDVVDAAVSGVVDGTTTAAAAATTVAAASARR